jgi:hypothetical protein
MELVSLYQFNESLHWIQKALADPFIMKSFPVWYHKALAECVLMRFSECESSLTWASFYASPEAEPYVETVYRYL